MLKRMFDVFSSVIKLEDKVSRHIDLQKVQQTKLENLTERLIRVEVKLEMMEKHSH